MSGRIESLEKRILLSSIVIDHHTLVVQGNANAFNTIILLNDADKSVVHVRVNGHTATFDMQDDDFSGIDVFGGSQGNYIADRAGVGQRKFVLATTLIGGNGNDTLIGGAANDLLDGGRSNDLLDAGGGDDTLVDGNGRDTLSGDAGDNVLIAGNGNDLLASGEGNSLLVAGNGNDTIIGGNGANELIGGSGVNVIFGGPYNDTIYGGGNPDTVIHPGTGHESIHRGALPSRTEILKQIVPRIPTPDDL